MGILNISGKSKTRKHNLQKDLREMLLVTRTGIENPPVLIVSYYNFHKTTKISRLNGLKYILFVLTFRMFL